MDDDIVELVDQLCTRAGMIMEDASPIAITMRQHRDTVALTDALSQLANADSTIVSLVDAAHALARSA